MKSSKHTQHVAVIDDDDHFAESLLALLGSAGIRAQRFSSAEDFVDVYRETEYDCLLIDWMLPGMSGEFLCRQLADRQTSARLMLMSGERSCDTLSSPLPSSVSFFDKPLDPDRLLDTIETSAGQ